MVTETFSLKLMAVGLADKLRRMQDALPCNQWRDYAARRIGDAPLAELHRPPPKR